MKLYVMVRFMNHDADVEFHRVITVTDVELTDYHQTVLRYMLSRSVVSV